MAGVFRFFMVFRPGYEVQLFLFEKKLQIWPPAKSDSLDARNFCFSEPSAQSSEAVILGLRSIGVDCF